MSASKGKANSNTKSPSLPKVVSTSSKTNIVNETLTKTASSINNASNNSTTNKSKSNIATTTKSPITVTLPNINNAAKNKTLILSNEKKKKNIEQVADEDMDNIDTVIDFIENVLESTMLDTSLDTSTNIEQSHTSSDMLNSSTVTTSIEVMKPQIIETTRIIHNNGKVILNYVMYNEEFAIVNGCLTQAEIDDVYCLSDAMPGCSIHLSRHPPNIGRQLEADQVSFEDIYIREDPKGTYHDLEDEQTLYVYVEEEAQQLARDQARMRSLLAIADDTLVSSNKNDNINIRDDGRNMESCSCVYGNHIYMHVYIIISSGILNRVTML